MTTAALIPALVIANHDVRHVRGGSCHSICGQRHPVPTGGPEILPVTHGVDGKATAVNFGPWVLVMGPRKVRGVLVVWQISVDAVKLLLALLWGVWAGWRGRAPGGSHGPVLVALFRERGQLLVNGEVVWWRQHIALDVVASEIVISFYEFGVAVQWGWAFHSSILWKLLDSRKKNVRHPIRRGVGGRGRGQVGGHAAHCHGLSVTMNCVRVEGAELWVLGNYGPLKGVPVQVVAGVARNARGVRDGSHRDLGRDIRVDVLAEFWVQVRPVQEGVAGSVFVLVCLGPAGLAAALADDDEEEDQDEDARHKDDYPDDLLQADVPRAKPREQLHLYEPYVFSHFPPLEHGFSTHSSTSLRHLATGAPIGAGVTGAALGWGHGTAGGNIHHVLHDSASTRALGIDAERQVLVIQDQGLHTSAEPISCSRASALPGRMLTDVAPEEDHVVQVEGAEGARRCARSSVVPV
ncbi:hypothetical protein JZ751_005925 [Albula glossodonta]|uniref:Uncharacterized protein n=1 Tax=Albula glossodonta TaxID=121402 RepID=A0A8T2PBW0_9TELE|nr:hypothetical protein JZ751_005925 [Albula glossodonta]